MEIEGVGVSERVRPAQGGRGCAGAAADSNTILFFFFCFWGLGGIFNSDRCYGVDAVEFIEIRRAEKQLGVIGVVGSI